ncbi:general secretion pathway protein GspB [Alteromonas hispanica]|uniref:GspB domain-containing protein n=1 Tax=Alteromonas hispanica TaxID=315421 RepID=A0A6L9MRF4_9ALTE|nr:general secretion pathway protein GspB [Alteromonas hispanica]NDW20530.1 GspB domain-containing protein [Alteromonas hispanica]
MSSIIAIENVKPGMVIIQITKQNGPVKIRKSGLVSSDAMVQGLSEMGVQEVEIDPEQTVEVATPTHHRTQTQALLRGQHDTSARFDKSLNDQFNRSLFLPTVESLPSSFSLYAKQALTFAVVIVGGLALGFTAATKSHWWPALSASFSEPSTSPVTNVNNAQKSDDLKEASANSTEEDSASNGAIDNSVQMPGQGTERISEPTTDKSTYNSIEQASESTPAGTQVAASNANRNSSNPNSSNTIPSNSNTPEVNDELLTQAPLPDNGTSIDVTNEYEGKVLNESEDSGKIEVSPELMARFNAAVEALDDKTSSANAEPETKVTVRDDTLRVDQLPVRLLTRLPTMNFSAHMYASNPRDRWVRVNGRQLSEGDWIADKVQIINIEAQRVVLAFEDEIFTMAALTDW